MGDTAARDDYRAMCVFARDVASAWCRDVARVRDDALDDLAPSVAAQLMTRPSAHVLTTWLRANMDEFSKAVVRVLAEVLVSRETDVLPTFRP